MSSGAGTGSPGRSADRVVALHGIRKRFGYRDVLHGVDLDVEPGICLSIFGPNGAGKSTLLRVISTQWLPSEGGGTVLGLDLVRDAQRIRRRLGVVMHQSFLRNELTLDENLRFYAALYDVDVRLRGPELLERFGLDHRTRDPVGTFSQGMTKRANLIRSLLHSPDLWILDEPFSGLDPAGQDLLRDGGDVLHPHAEAHGGGRLQDQQEPDGRHQQPGPAASYTFLNRGSYGFI